MAKRLRRKYLMSSGRELSALMGQRRASGMLDDASRALALEEVKNAGDKEELLAALDEMGVRNAKLTQANKEKDEQRASLDKLLGESRRKEYELQRKLDAMERPVSPDDEARALIWTEANMHSVADGARTRHLYISAFCGNGIMTGIACRHSITKADAAHARHDYVAILCGDGITARGGVHDLYCLNGCQHLQKV